MPLDEFQGNCNYYYYSVFNNPSLKPALGQFTLNKQRSIRECQHSQKHTGTTRINIYSLQQTAFTGKEM